MKCKKCGGEEWYRRGTYKRCIPCHNEVQLVSYHNRKLGIKADRRKSHQSKPIAQQLKNLPTGITLEKRLMTACGKGHEFNKENTRLEVDRFGRIHRRCLQCMYLYTRKRYGLDNPSRLKDLLQEKDNPWDTL
jgi:hypothetical protein